MKRKVQFKGFGKPTPHIKPSYSDAVIAGWEIASMYPGKTVETRHCLYCGDYFHVIVGKDSEGCDTCSRKDFEVVNESIR